MGYELVLLPLLFVGFIAALRPVAFSSASDEAEGDRGYSGMRMPEQVERNASVTLSLTPRLIAVTSRSPEPVTVSTVFLPAWRYRKHLCA
jgi:hypothetical protein